MSSPWRGWDRRALGEEQQPDRLARERRPKHQALGEGVKEIRALQDAASKAGEPAPDIAKCLAELIKAAPVSYREEGALRHVIGTAEEHHEVITRNVRAYRTRKELHGP